MAIASGDGSIILTTKIDTSGVEKGMKNLRGAVSKTESALAKLGSYAASYFGFRAFINFSREAGEMATQQEANIKRLIDIYGEASQTVGDFIDENARALGMSKSAAASFSAVYGNLFSVWADQQTNAEMTNRYLNMTAVVASKSGRTVEDVQERIRSGLLGNTEAIEDLGIFVNVKTIEMTDSFKRMADGRSWEQLSAYEQQQVRTLAILEQSTKKYGNEVAETSSLIRAKYNAAYQDFQATWGQFVNTVLLPILQVATQIFDVLTAGLQTIAGITGKTVENSENVSESIGKSTENQKQLKKEIKGTNKELKKSLAGFDEIQILTQNTGVGSTSSGEGVDDFGLKDTTTGAKQAEEVNAMLGTIMGVVGASLAALGVLLMLGGHFGIGAMFLIAGAGVFGISEAAISGSDLGVAEKLTAITGMVGGALAAIGVVILLKGGKALMPLAIGMIVAGIAIFAISAAQTKANSVEKDVGDKMHAIIAAASAALLAIGIILLFMGGPAPLGIALMAAGAVGLATEVDLYGNRVVEGLKGQIGLIVGIVSAALLALGIILCCCGVVNPLSIGLIVAGAVGLATVVAVNWDYLVELMRGKIGVITAIVSAALLVIGIILLFTGVGTGLGIGLILAGAAGLATVVAVNWNFLSDKIKEVWGNVKEFWNTHIAQIFTAQWWTDLGKTCINGLIAGFEGGINGIIWAFETMINWIIKNLNKLSFDIPEWVPGIGGNTWGINIPPVKFDRVSIPRLARGAVIPANKEFLAVLGDQKQGVNIEAPLQTIVDAFNIALAQNGGAGGGNIEVVLEIDGREFGRAVVEQGNKENRRRGTRLVMA